jgi:hypothetical protein
VSLTITRAHRDAIYEMLISHLTAIGDVWLCIDRREFATAKRLGREFAEDLRLLEDLGWSETIDGEAVALTVPLDVLTRTVARLHKDARRAPIFVSRLFCGRPGQDRRNGLFVPLPRRAGSVRCACS